MDSTQPVSVPILNPSPQTLLNDKQQRTQRAWKFAIRSVATVPTICALALQIRIATASSGSYRGYYYDSDYYYYEYGQTGWLSPESFATLCLALGWNIAEFITFCVNKKGIVPGVHVGLDLVIWLGLLVSAVIQFLVDYRLPIALAAGSMKVVSCVLHFVLFVWACVDTDRRRKTMRAQIVAQVTAAMQQQTNQQQMQQQSQPMSNTGLINVPPGMALVPVEALAQLQQPQASYQPYPEAQNMQDHGHRTPISPLAPGQGMPHPPPP